MSENVREAICFMDLKKRMAGLCEAPDINETEAEFILLQIRRLN